MSSSVLEKLFVALPDLRDFHAPTCAAYDLLRAVSFSEIKERFSSTEAISRDFGQFGDLIFPYMKLGNIDTFELFKLDELIIFSFYLLNAKRYKKCLDMGANIGLHSILMSRCGFDVTSFEPDPSTYETLKLNLKNNGAIGVKPINAAVSVESGSMEFVRVCGNTTGSHLAGSKSNVYGDIERFPVEVLPFASLIQGVDFIKMDVEGHEKTILTSTTAADWAGIDMMVEVGSVENAAAIFQHFKNLGVNMFAQKISWQLVTSVEHVPTSHREGSLFITSKPQMLWG